MSQSKPIEQCEYCGVYPRPALEHKRGCKIRLEFYGGDASWDTSKDQYHHDGARFTYKDDMATWMPVFEPLTQEDLK